MRRRRVSTTSLGVERKHGESELEQSTYLDLIDALLLSSSSNHLKALLPPGPAQLPPACPLPLHTSPSSCSTKLHFVTATPEPSPSFPSAAARQPHIARAAPPSPHVADLAADPSRCRPHGLLINPIATIYLLCSGTLCCSVLLRTRTATRCRASQGNRQLTTPNRPRKHLSVILQTRQLLAPILITTVINPPRQCPPVYLPSAPQYIPARTRVLNITTQHQTMETGM